MMLVITLATRYLAARLRQSVLTIGGIALGMVALTVIQSMMGGFRAEFVKKTLATSPEIIVRRRPPEKFDPVGPTRQALASAAAPLTPTLLEAPRPPLPDEAENIRSVQTVEAALGEVTGVAATAPLITGQVMFTFSGASEPVNVNGIIPSRHSRVVEFRKKLTGGTDEELERSTSGVVLGKFLADRMRVHVGDRVVARGQDGAAVSLRVVALHDSYVYEVDNTTAWVNLRRAQSLLSLSGQVNAVQVRTTDYNRAEEIARAIEYRVGMDAESWMEANKNVLGLLNMIVSIMTMVTVFTMSVAGFGIAGNLITTVAEKTFDIGVLKAMGMTSGRIVAVFLLLSMLMMSLGLILGMGISYGVVELLSNVKSAIKPGPGVIVASENMPMIRSWTIYITSGLFAVVVSLIAGLAPSLKAARLEPLGILRNAAG